MFTPFIFLIFKPAPVLHYVLLVLAIAELLIWEITYRRHSERFTEDTNDRLSCRNCNERLCRHNKFYPHKHALLKMKEAKRAEIENEKTNV